MTSEELRAEALSENMELPIVIRSDNGSPFATSNAPHGLSRLSLSFLIELTGGHERMHRDIKAEVRMPGGRSSTSIGLQTPAKRLSSATR
jgi:hypothetical protein